MKHAHAPELDARARRITIAFFALIAFPFFCVYPYIASINNPNENVRVYMTMAIVDFGTFRIDEVTQRHGWVNDMAKAPDPKTGESHLYSIKAPAMGYLGVPIYAAMKGVAKVLGHAVPTAQSPPEARAAWFRGSVFVLRLFGVQLPCFLFLIFFERFLRKTTGDLVLRLTAVAAVGVGTNYLGYAMMFVSHALFGIVAFLAFALVTGERRRAFDDARARRVHVAFLAGLAAGFATLLEYQAFVVSSVLALYAFSVFYRPKQAAAFLGGAAINAALLMFYQYRCYGNPLTPGHKMAENQVFATWHQQGFFGLGTPEWTTFRDLSFSPAFGFFSLSPYMGLGLLAIPFGLVLAGNGPRAERATRRWATLGWLAAMSALWIAISAAVNWRGGWTLGPRFFGAAPPFFAFGAVTALEAIAQRRPWVSRPLVRGLSGGMMLAGVVQIGIVGLVWNTYPESVTRPLPQVAWPLARAGFVPYHVGDLIGLSSPVVFYVIAALLVLGALLAAFVPAPDALGDSTKRYPLRAVALGLAFVLGVAPTLTKPLPGETDGAGDLAFLSHNWEPSGRDYIQKLREQAERYGPRRPCAWHRLAALERSVHWEAEAAAHAARAEDTDASTCPKRFPF
jgi:hypothetical protein